MDRQNRTRPPVKLVFRRGRAIVSVALLAVILLSTVALAGLTAAIRAARIQEADDRAAAARLEQENRDLSQRISELGTADSVRQIARESLGLEDPNAVVFIMEEAE